MDTHALKEAEEPHITGELVKSAKVLLESPEADSWMEHLELLDDPLKMRLAGMAKGGRE